MSRACKVIPKVCVSVWGFPKGKTVCKYAIWKWINLFCDFPRFHLSSFIWGDVSTLGTLEEKPLRLFLCICCSRVSRYQGGLALVGLYMWLCRNNPNGRFHFVIFKSATSPRIQMRLG